MFRSLLFFLLIPSTVFSQIQQQPSAAEIKLKLKKLNFLGSVLYVAAHPDDENTRAITYFANDRLAATAYLSMTRGDGGQNLIGSEMRDELGLIRTQELVAARRVDGGQQFFTRANDFGFSKSADETFQVWGKDEILSDVVRVYRQVQPDVIITRFPADERAGHGHHTASAMLAQEAFDVALMTDRYTDQLQYYKAWQPKSMYTNTGRWWNQTINENTPGIITLNVGEYNALLGTSYTEIASISRSQHKSQGFGSRGTRGDQLEFLEFVKGEKAEKDVFENVNTTWSRIPGGEKVQPLVTKAIAEFNEENPAASINVLLQIRKQLINLESSVWRNRKLDETNKLIQACLGLYAEAIGDQYWISASNLVTVSMEFTNRANVEIQVEKISSQALQYDTLVNAVLKRNKPLQLKTKKIVRGDVPNSDPYWLQQAHSIGLFTVKKPSDIGKPELGAAIELECQLKIGEEKLTLLVPLVYRTVDPVKGELIRAVEVVPPAFVNLADKVMIFNTERAKEVKVLVKSSTDSKQSGQLSLTLPVDWRSEPASISIELSKRGEEQTKSFLVYPSKQESTGTLKAVLKIGDNVCDKSLKTIAYDHIPTQTLLPTAAASVSRIDLKREGSVIGYIKGAGDDVPAALRNMGYEVWEMKNEEITADNLKRLDAVILGVRAFNTNDRLRFVMNDLLGYVKQGGTMVVQYNTNFDLETDTYSPYPLTLSRDRVTEEDAEVRLIKPDHPLLNSPNKITEDDFKGWVQERGLYFPNKWDPAFEALLSMNDKSEPAKDGSLLVAKYGEGQYIYTGLSFFRELPEGVRGAYKLFANLVSAGKPKKVATAKVKTRSK
jgi:LmbE family N-acetylglucosaminyl deacetylase